MENSVQKLSTGYDIKDKKLSSSKEEIVSNIKKFKSFDTQKDINSWDCSTPSENGITPKQKLNDWDSNSDCQETMVEAFGINDNLNYNDWDSDSDSQDCLEKNLKQAPIFGDNIVDPFYFSKPTFSDASKTSRCATAKNENEKQEPKSREEDFLLVEDFEDHAKDNPDAIISNSEESPPSAPTSSSSTSREKVQSNQFEGTPEDTTIWMIPKIERTESGESINKLISSSDREKIEKLKQFRDISKKTKSLSDMQKNKHRSITSRSSRSEKLGSQKNNYNTFLLCEGSNLQRKLEIVSKDSKKNILSREKFHRTRVFFTEYECKAMTIDKDVPEKLSSRSSSDVNTNEDVLPENVVADSEENSTQTPVENSTRETTKEENNEMEQPGSSGATSVNAASSSCGIKNSLKVSQNNSKETMTKETGFQKPVSQNELPMKTCMSESWFLFDEAGQYQEISKNEVSILFNGRSADAVLQGRTEHFIPTSTLKNTGSLKNSLSNFGTKESLQYILREDDTGGDDEFKKLIDLERKVENTLFYIRPETDHKTSVRIIPVNAEMIHIWRRTRDSGTSNVSIETQVLEQQLRDTAVANSRPKPESSASTQPCEKLFSEKEKEIIPSATSSPQFSGSSLSESPQNESSDFSKLLVETRVIVDVLTNNFNTLQTRLDGETNRSMALEEELRRLRFLVKTSPDNVKCADENSKKTDYHLIKPVPTASLLTLKASDKVDTRSDGIIEEEDETIEEEKEEEGQENENEKEVKEAEESTTRNHLELQDKSTSIMSSEILKNENEREVRKEETPQEETSQEGNNVITVNIYTVEGSTSLAHFGENHQETYSVAQTNLKLIEKKMKRLQQENVILTKQNIELKRKLKEISLELEKYLASTSYQDSGIEDSRELEQLKEEVFNLKLELENFKTFARNQEDTFTEENLLIREEFSKSLSSLNDWCAMASEIYNKTQTLKSKLEDIGITINENLELCSTQDPKNFCSFLLGYLEQTSRCLFIVKDENFLYEKALKESREAKEITGLDQVISGYSELIEQCRKGQITGETKSKVMEDYFAVIMEKASLMEEVKILKTENEMLLESQLEHYEKLKQTMIALKDRKSEISALESSQKLSEDEKTRMAEVLKLYEEEKKIVELELLEKTRIVEDLIVEMKRKELEICDCSEKLKGALAEINSYENSYRLKDEMINELKIKNIELLNADRVNNDQIEDLKVQIKNLEIQKNQCEAELSSAQLFLDESQKEMTDYITHLEALVSSLQESLEKNKQKLKECNQNINRLKSEREVLEKQHQCDVKLFNSTKDELESFKEKLVKADNKLKESEEEREKLNKKCETIVSSEKQKSEALESLTKEHKITLEENTELKERVKIYSRDKDELLTEQKDLINKYGLLSKEIRKLQEKYRSIKAECNERTDIIKYLEMMLQENLVEYNSRVACLEQNISQIIEKIIAYKNGMKEKYSGVDPEVKELRHQLSIACQERKELENVVDNYYSLMKHFESEMQEREKKVDGQHLQLSLEQQKAVECQNEKPVPVLLASKTSDISKIEQLETQIAVTETELGECKGELQRYRTNYENEKKKLELTIADLQSEVKRYQLRIEVMMRNLSTSSKNSNVLVTDKRNEHDSELQSLKKEMQEKDKTISELNDSLIKFKSELKLKDGDLENFKKKNFYQSEELKNLQNKVAQLQDVMSTTNKTTEYQQKERDEMAEKLFQSIKLIMEERSARQTAESLALEKERNYKSQMEQIKNELLLKVKECDSVKEVLEDKKKLINKLEDDLNKLTVQMATLKRQVNNRKKRNVHTAAKKEEFPYTSNSLTELKSQYVPSERLESCLKELKEIRDFNLELRKTEGQYQAKIVRLEDEIRDARLLIKELQGDIKTEKKSKMAFRNMIFAAKTEIEKCVMAKQLMSVVAEKISRHLDLSEIPSRELLSGFRLSDSSSSLRICT